MENLHDRHEQWITRRLDGRICAEDELELKREMLRNPKVRADHDLSLRIDALVEAAMQRLGDDAEEAGPFASSLTTSDQRRSSFPGYSWKVPVALAAVLAFAFFVQPEQVLPPIPFAGGEPAAKSASILGHSKLDQPGFQSSPRESVHRLVDRELLGLLGDDGKMYWVQVDHTKTLRAPNPAVRLARCDF